MRNARFTNMLTNILPVSGRIARKRAPTYARVYHKYAAVVLYVHAELCIQFANAHAIRYTRMERRTATQITSAEGEATLMGSGSNDVPN